MYVKEAFTNLTALVLALVLCLGSVTSTAQALLISSSSESQTTLPEEEKVACSRVGLSRQLRHHSDRNILRIFHLKVDDHDPGDPPRSSDKPTNFQSRYYQCPVLRAPPA
jgi:hypothetical protein